VLTNDWTKCRKWGICQECEGQNGRAIFVGDKFSQGHIETQLHSLSKAIYGTSNDQGVNIVCDGADDDADQCDGVSPDEELAATEKVWKTSKESVSESEGQSSGNVGPSNIWTRS